MKTVIFIGSYSGADASTAIKLLREMGVPCVSTSEILYELSEGIDELVDSFSGAAIAYTKHREFRKGLAEDVIKKVLGRSAFAISAANKLKPLIETYDCVAMDCFDQWDYLVAIKELCDRIDSAICINITSPNQDKDVDGQELLSPLRGNQKEFTIQNPITEEGLKAELMKLIPVPTVPHV